MSDPSPHADGRFITAQKPPLIDRLAPRFIRPYLRLMRADKPIGTWLLFIPGLWAIGLATYAGGPLVAGSEGQRLYPDFSIIGLFLIGAFVMRGAGCVINDILDRDIDAQVARTKSRPIPSGDVSVLAAIIFLGALCLIGLSVLLQLNMLSIILGASSLVLVGLYPLMKRITYWPQAWLGLTINWGALLGYTAVADRLDPPAFLLYAAGFFWTLGYDTIYGHQDKRDDALIGVKSSALYLGNRTKPFVAVCYGLTLVLVMATGPFANMYLPFYGLLAFAGLHALWQILALDIDDPEICLKLFKSNRDFGILVAIAIYFGRAFPLGVLGT